MSILAKTLKLKNYIASGFKKFVKKLPNKDTYWKIWIYYEYIWHLEIWSMNRLAKSRLRFKYNFLIGNYNSILYPIS